MQGSTPVWSVLLVTVAVGNRSIGVGCHVIQYIKKEEDENRKDLQNIALHVELGLFSLVGAGQVVFFFNWNWIFFHVFQGTPSYEYVISKNPSAGFSMLEFDPIHFILQLRSRPVTTSLLKSRQIRPSLSLSITLPEG